MGKCIDVSQILVHKQRLISRLIPDISRLIHVLVDYPLTYSRLTHLPGNSCALCLSTVISVSRLSSFGSRLIALVVDYTLPYSRLMGCPGSCILSVADLFLCQSTCLFPSRLVPFIVDLVHLVSRLILPLVDYSFSIVD